VQQFSFKHNPQALGSNTSQPLAALCPAATLPSPEGAPGATHLVSFSHRFK
jgi:hypothetical protein